MANKIILKRSSVSGKVPTTSDLSLGELGINTTDGKVFLNQNDSSVEQFLITNTGVPVTGSVTLSGSIYTHGNQQITGSLVVSASGTQAATVYGSGSSVFQVIGTQGTLWSVEDNLSGSLFSVGDITGFQQFEVFSDGDVYMGDEAQAQTLHRTANLTTTANTTQSITTISTSSFDGAFFDYVATSASNARAGNLMSVWNGSNVVYNETTTNDIGDTSGLSLLVEFVNGQAALRSLTTTSDWVLKVNSRIM